jgi:hypothetical protein
MCVQETKTANRFEISSLLKNILLRRVTDHCSVNHSIIVRLMQRFRQTGNVTVRPRAGKPRKTTPREDRLISRRARQRPFSTAGALRGNLAVSQRMIVEMGDYARSEHIVTVFLACQITIKNAQVQLTVKGKTTSDSYTPKK